MWSIFSKQVNKIIKVFLYSNQQGMLLGSAHLFQHFWLHKNHDGKSKNAKLKGIPQTSGWHHSDKHATQTAWKFNLFSDTTQVSQTAFHPKLTSNKMTFKTMTFQQWQEVKVRFWFDFLGLWKFTPQYN